MFIPLDIFTWIICSLVKFKVFEAEFSISPQNYLFIFIFQSPGLKRNRERDGMELVLFQLVNGIYIWYLTFMPNVLFQGHNSITLVLAQLC